jgi:transcriptional regulator with XRE-family HTH domain
MWTGGFWGQRLEQSESRARSPRRGGGPHVIDVHVGSRVRLRRNMLGLSQEKLGEALGLTFQQIQKYERGVNRIGASRLMEIARVLDVPIAFFYDDTDPVRAPPIPKDLDEAANRDPARDYLAREDAAELVASYYAIKDERLRRDLFDLIKALWVKDNPGSSRRAVSKRRKGRVSDVPRD